MNGLGRVLDSGWFVTLAVVERGPRLTTTGYGARALGLDARASLDANDARTFFEALDDDAIVQRSDVHALFSVSLSCGNLADASKFVPGGARAGLALAHGDC